MRRLRRRVVRNTRARSCALFASETRKVGPGYLILALTFLETDQINPVRVNETVDRFHEALGQRLQQGGRGDEMTQVIAQEADQPHIALELRHVGVEVESVEALHFQGDVLAEDVGQGRVAYIHSWRGSRGPSPYRTTTAPCGS